MTEERLQELTLKCEVEFLLNRMKHLTDVECFPGCNAECLGKLTTGSGEKTMFNGQVLEPLVLLMEVIHIMPLPSALSTSVNECPEGKMN